jgi:hypothetical protein
MRKLTARALCEHSWGERMSDIVSYGRVSMEFIAGGVEDFTMVPELGGVPLDTYVTAQCEGSEEERYTPTPSGEGDVVCSYLLLYPTRGGLTVKVGNSGLSNCVARMFQQAPVVGVVAEVVRVDRQLRDREELDRAVVQALKALASRHRSKSLKIAAITTKINRDVAIASWRFVVQRAASVSIEKLVDQGLELASEVSRTLSGFGEVLLPSPGYCWFSPLGALNERDKELLRTCCDIGSVWGDNTYRGKLRLRHLPNGLFHVVLLEHVQKGLDGRAVEGLLTFNDLKSARLEVIKE